ncbi:hypothetical protein FGO68_gene5740 [Halteria grandinella]|uniref:Uncharacterized protein n=1 Tax=Halteria grandinella TaxID=5974 RepID=A0A8J8SWS7_HALGN|nr:hypothetical protein FGO68_gene5740 [Halteria grandinella]
MYERVKKLVLKISVTQINGLPQKLSEFSNVRVLKLQYQTYEGAFKDLIQLMQSLKKLIKLQFETYKQNGPIYSDQIQGLLQFTIDNMKELRSLILSIHHPIQLRNIELFQRAQPIIITVKVFHKTQYIIDTRQGIREFF